MAAVRRKRRAGVTVIRRKTMPDLVVPSEHAEQCSLFNWARINERKYPCLALLFAVPNGARVRPKEAKKLKAEGIKAGIPDVILPVPRGNHVGLAVELKRIYGGKVSDDQEHIHALMVGEGWRVEVCRGHNQAIDAITDYLKGDEP